MCEEKKFNWSSFAEEAEVFKCECGVFTHKSGLCHLYERKFQPGKYVMENYSCFNEEIEFCLRNLHRFFTREVEPGVERKVESRRILEIGAGPVPIHMLSASRWSDFIVFSDFLEINRKRLSGWVDRQSSAVDDQWLTSAQFVSKLEYEDPVCTPREAIKQHRRQTGLSLLQRLRCAIRAVIPFDVLHHDLLLDAEAHKTTFDVVFSAFCIERVVASFNCFKKAIANIVRVLSPSGYLVLTGELGGIFFNVNDVQVPTLELTADMVHEAITEGGCVMVDWIEFPRRRHSALHPANFSDIYFCVARKIGKLPADELAL